MSRAGAGKPRHTYLRGFLKLLCLMLLCGVACPRTATAAISRVTSDGANNSGPHFNNDGSKLTFFSAKNAGSSEIYVVNSDGTGETRLTNDGFRDYQPHFSRDGQKIVYKSVRDGNSNVWVMNADGSNKTQITFELCGEDSASPPTYGADWSPGDSRIVFDSRRSGNYDIWLMNADGSNPVQLTFEASAQAHPHFSPDGSKIVYWSEQSGERAIWVMDADGANTTMVTAPATNHPHFNYDGSRIIFGYDSQGYLANVDGSGREPFPYAANAGIGDWSHDGSKMAYASQGDIYLYSGDLIPPAVYAYPAGAPYPSPVTVKLFSNEGGSIRYTTDGSEPSALSTLYSAPLTISGSTLLKFIAIDAAANSSPVKSEQYQVGPEVALYAESLAGTYETIQSTTESADVTIHHGYVIKYIATGALSGYLTDFPSDLVSITSGTYAGWKFRKAQYQIDSYTGTVYMLYNSAEDKAWGVMSGDIHGVRMDAAGISKLFLTSIRGVPASGTVDLAGAGDYHGAVESLPASQLTIVTNSNTVTGPATGALHNNASRVKISGVAGAFTVGRYQGAEGDGNLYQYSEDSPTYPGIIRNFGMADGPLLGTRELEVPVPTSAGSPFQVRAERVLGERVPPAAPKYITNSIQWMQEVLPSTSESVDITREEGAVLTFAASGAVSGEFVENRSHWVIIQSGSYAGWGYAKGAYQIGPYSGTCYMVSNGTKGWGMLTGDLHGARIWDGESRKIHLTSIGGAQASGVIDLATPRKQAGSQSFLTGVTLYLTQSSSSGATAGLYNDGFEVSAKSIRLGPYPEGIMINNYHSPSGDGMVYLYAGNQQQAYQGMRYSYGMGDGPLFGPRQVAAPWPGGAGTDRYVRIEHVLDATPPAVTATPAAGSYQAPQTVTLQANEAATIYYAVDGFASYAVYSAPILVSGTNHLKYYAVDPAGNTSEVQQATYTIETSVPEVTVAPAAGYYATAQTITLGTAGTATIYYSLNGQGFNPYSGPFTIDSGTSLSYYAVDGAGTRGPDGTAYYNVYVRPEVTAVNATFTSFGPSRTESADVTVQQGQTMTLRASGFIEAELVQTVSRLVAIKSGAYAGWSYLMGSYRLGAYSGSFNVLSNGSQTWGLFEGDINGALIRNGNVQTLYVTSINGEPSSGKVDLTLVGSTPPASSDDYPGMTLTIGQNSQTATSTGRYAEPMELQFNYVFVQQLRDGIVLGSYQSSLGGGSVYLYADNQDQFYYKRRGILTGGMLATYEGYVPLPAQVGSSNHFMLKQYTGSRARSTSTLITAPAANRVVEADGNQQISVLPFADPTPLAGPVNAQRVAGYRTLITDMGNNRVIEVDADGTVTWQFSDLSSPRWAERLFNGNTLIADCLNHRVIEVTPYGKIVWQYGVTGMAGAGVGQLNQPTAAYRLADGTTLIADCMNHRVLLVKAGDYNPAAADYGWKSSSVVWQYGETGVAGSAANHLNTPRRAQPLESGNVLIGDTENHRVIEVSRDKRIIWQHGSAGLRGGGSDLLNSPRSVQRLVNGDTIIADIGNSRVVEVGPAHDVVWEYLGVQGTSALDVLPTSAVPDIIPPGGTLLINGGATSTSSPFVYLTSSVYDNSGSVVAMRFSEDNSIWKGWQPFAINKSWALAPEVGAKTMYAQYRDVSGNVMSTSATITLTAVPQETSSLSAGTDVTAAPSPTSSLSFSDVTVAGTVTVTPVVPVSEPANFKVLSGASYEIVTDAVHQGIIEVCLGYNDAALANPYNEGRIRLFHMENGVWQDITKYVDTFNKKVCGDTTSLSPFGIGEPAAAPVTVITSPLTGAALPLGAITVSGEATDSVGIGILQVEVSTNNGVSWELAVDSSGGGWDTWSYAWSPGSSGTYVIKSRATDTSGTIEDPGSGITVTVDGASPSVWAFPAGGIYNASQAVTLSASEPCTIYYTLDGSLPTTGSAMATEPIAISASTTLRFMGRDAAGNQSPTQTAVYTLVGGPLGSVVIDSGSDAAEGSAVLLTVSAASPSGAVSQMRFSNDGVAWGSWLPYGSTASWQLSSGDGVKTVYAQFRDAAGVESQSPHAADTILLYSAAAPGVAARVPVMNGWWIVPGVLSGLLVLRRRRR